MVRLRLLAGLAAGFVLGVPIGTFADPVCKPLLEFNQVRFSAAQDQHRKWTAILAVEASRCAERSGLFEIKFVRLKEVGPDLQFSERFRWSPVMVEVSLDFWWDESVGDYWIGEVLPCRCVN